MSIAEFSGSWPSLVNREWMRFEKDCLELHPKRLLQDKHIISLKMTMRDLTSALYKYQMWAGGSLNFAFTPPLVCPAFAHALLSLQEGSNP